MADKMSVEERLEKLEAHKSQDQKRKERADELERLKRTPIKYVDDDPKRIHMSYDEVIKAKQAKKDEMAEFEKFKADKKAKKSEPKEEPKEEVKAPVKSKGRPKRVE